MRFGFSALGEIIFEVISGKISEVGINEFLKGARGGNWCLLVVKKSSEQRALVGAADGPCKEFYIRYHNYAQNYY